MHLVLLHAFTETRYHQFGSCNSSVDSHLEIKELRASEVRSVQARVLQADSRKKEFHCRSSHWLQICILFDLHVFTMSPLVLMRLHCGHPFSRMQNIINSFPQRGVEGCSPLPYLLSFDVVIGMHQFLYYFHPLSCQFYWLN